MPNYYDIFISYGRVDSKDFAIRLNQRLEKENFNVWFDQNDIPPAVDWQKQINDGIKRADNFLFIISPHSVKSKYCLKEIKLAAKLNKRILPLLHVNADAEYDLMHPAIKKTNWLTQWEETNENFDFEASFQILLKTLRKDADYIRQHTKYLISAWQWQTNQRQTQYLLIGQDRVKAESWLKIKFSGGKQLPCLPTDLHCEYICESTKNANNLLTQVFISHNERDNRHREKLVKALNRQGITTWTNKTDIQSGTEFQEEINKGIEGADNFVYLLSPNSLACTYCLRELNHALKYNKRIIPILVESFDLTNIPTEIKNVQFIDFTKTEKLNELIKLLTEDANYYQKHKILLVKTLKWKTQNQNRSLLLRGYNLQHFEAWLNTGLSRNLHPPLPLHLEFIQASRGQTTEEVLDVFISYSRADADFARKLNNQLQELGKTTWFDQESIAVGEDFQKEIEKGIELCDNFVFIISPRSVNSPYCANEVEYAVKLNKRLITILVEKLENQNLHPELAKVQWIDFRQGDFYLHFSELIRLLDTDREYIRSHNKWLQKALEWNLHQKNPDLLLRGMQLSNVQHWLKKAQQENKKPSPTLLLKEYVDQSVLDSQRQQEKQEEFQRKSDKADILDKLDTIESLTNQTPIKGLMFAVNLVGESYEKLGKVISKVENSFYQAAKTIRECNVFTGHQDEVTCVAFSPLNDFIVSGSKDKSIRIWHKSGLLKSPPLNCHRDEVNSLAISPDSEYILSASKKDLQLIDKAGNLIKSLSKYKKTNIFQFIKTIFSDYFSFLIIRIITIIFFSFLIVWLTGIGLFLENEPFYQNLNNYFNNYSFYEYYWFCFYLQLLTSFTLAFVWLLLWLCSSIYTFRKGFINAVTFNSDNECIVNINCKKLNSKIISLNKKGEINKKPLQVYPSLFGFIESQKYKLKCTSIYFDNNNKKIITGYENGSIQINNQKGEMVNGYLYKVKNFLFECKITYLLCLIGSLLAFTLSFFLYDSYLSSNFYSSLPYAPIASWDKLFEFLFLVIKIAVLVLIFFQLIESFIMRISTQRGYSNTPFSGHKNSVTSISTSNDGKYIVSGSKDKTVRLWDIYGNSVCQPFKKHEDEITSVDFSPDDEYIVSGSKDKTIRLWDIYGNLVGEPFKGHQDEITSVSFSPNGEYIVSGSKDKTIRLWYSFGLSKTNIKQDFQLICDRLLQHPSIINPNDEISEKAAKTCLKYCSWNNHMKANFLISQGNMLMKKGDLEGAETKFKQAKNLEDDFRIF